MQRPLALPLSEVRNGDILFSINGFTNAQSPRPYSMVTGLHFSSDRSSMSIKEYQSKFNHVVHHLKHGDSYLANLTVKTRVETNRSLKQLFFLSRARFKLWFKNEFLVFSPERFIQIKDCKIVSFPMKGTIDASLPNAHKSILTNPKELAEHVTIVDLIRNDLSLVSSSVSVKRFRYLEEVKTHNKTLLQVSSEIQGNLPPDYHTKIGDILVSLLPAGSVSGAPKGKTVQILRNAEGENRDYFTGVFGYFDGDNLDTGVMIRYIEKTNAGLFFRSGGGITAQSIMESEYQEAMDKVYVPVY